MFEIDGYTRTCGLIGNPVEHTMSPVIHNNLAEYTKVNLCYVPFHVETGRIGDAVKGAFALNLLGVNVTVPYKSDVIPFLSDIDDLAAKIGAVNTLVRTESGYKGYNTDMPGLYRAMKYDGVSIEGEDVIILGAGGVARAVAILMAEKNAASVLILNRTVEKAQAVADEVNGYAGKQLVRVKPISDYSSIDASKKYVVIQATNIGMFPKTDEAVIEDASFYSLVKVGYDLIFNPAETKFMTLCKAAGVEAFNGLRMLLYQGIIAYEYWTEKAISDDMAEQIYSKMDERLRGKNN